MLIVIKHTTLLKTLFIILIVNKTWSENKTSFGKYNSLISKTDTPTKIKRQRKSLQSETHKTYFMYFVSRNKINRIS